MKNTAKVSATVAVVSAACAVVALQPAKQLQAYPVLNENGLPVKSLFDGIKPAPGHPRQHSTGATVLVGRSLEKVASWLEIDAVQAQGCESSSDCQGDAYPWWEDIPCEYAECAGGGDFWAYTGPNGYCGVCYPIPNGAEDCGGCLCHITSCQFC